MLFIICIYGFLVLTLYKFNFFKKTNMINSKFVLSSVFSGLLMFTSCSRDVIVEQSFRTPSAKEI